MFNDIRFAFRQLFKSPGLHACRRRHARARHRRQHRHLQRGRCGFAPSAALSPLRADRHRRANRPQHRRLERGCFARQLSRLGGAKFCLLRDGLRDVARRTISPAANNRSASARRWPRRSFSRSSIPNRFSDAPSVRQMRNRGSDKVVVLELTPSGRAASEPIAA